MKPQELLSIEQKLHMKSKMQFGKHIGKTLGYVMKQDKYCQWLINQPGMNDNIVLWELLNIFHSDKRVIKQKEEKPKIFDKLIAFNDAIAKSNGQIDWSLVTLEMYGKQIVVSPIGYPEVNPHELENDWMDHSN